MTLNRLLILESPDTPSVCSRNVCRSSGRLYKFEIAKFSCTPSAQRQRVSPAYKIKKKMPGCQCRRRRPQRRQEQSGYFHGRTSPHGCRSTYCSRQNPKERIPLPGFIVAAKRHFQRSGKWGHSRFFPGKVCGPMSPNLPEGSPPLFRDKRRRQLGRLYISCICRTSGSRK